MSHRTSLVRIAAAAAAFTVLALGGCAATAGAESTPAASATPTPTTAPSDPLESVTTIVARPQALELRDESGTVVASLDYLGDAAEAIATLETVFGAAPASEEYPGNSHYTPGIAYQWGGMELRQPEYTGHEAELPRSYYLPSFSVRFTAPTSGDTEQTTDEGYQVGAVWTELVAEPALQTNPSGCSGPYLDFVEVPMTDADGNAYDQRVAVVFRPSDDESAVAWISAPLEIHDECA
ncbi:MAG: hypothetical protein ACRDT9_07060 [Agromyces sp.]